MCSRLIPVLALTASIAFAQNKLDPRSKMHLTLPEDAPIGVAGADFSDTTESARGGAILLDLHTSLVFKNTAQKRIRGVTLLVVAQEVTPGGKASVTVPSINVAPGETFPVRIDLRLLLPLQASNGRLVEIGLDGVLFDDLSFYGSDKLNSRRAMTVWELEARRDRKYYRNLLETGGQEALKQEMIASLDRQAQRSGMDAHVVQAQGRSTNAITEHQARVAFLDMPNAPVEVTGGHAGIAGDEARRPTIFVASRSERSIRSMEVGWLLKDEAGKTFVTGVIPVNVSLPPYQSTTVIQDGTFKFSQANGKPVLIDNLSGYVTSVEYADGKMWVPERSSRIVTLSPEEQRLSQIYRKKGMQALLEELRKF